MLRTPPRVGKRLVDGRRMMIAGGAMTAVATVAVGGFVAVSSATALADHPGRALDVAPIVVPSPAVSSTAAPVLESQSIAPVLPEIVPAPMPDDIADAVDRVPAEPDPAHSTPAPFTPPPQPVTPAAPPPPVLEPGADPADALERAREWAREQGWDAARIESWLAEMQARAGESERSRIQAPVAPTGIPSDPESPSSRFGSEEEQPSESPTPND